MREGAWAIRCVRDLTRLVFGQCNELGQRTDRDSDWVDQKDVRNNPKHSDEGEVRRRIIGQLLIKGLIDCEYCLTGHQDGVAICAAAGDVLTSDISSGTSPTLNNDLLTKSRPYLLGRNPSKDVCRTTRRKWNNHVRRP